MAKESVEAKREWLHNQLNGAIALIVLSVLFVALRCVGVGFVNWKQRRVKPMFWEDTLVLASLVGFLPLCACAIGSHHATFLCEDRIDVCSSQRSRVYCLLLHHQPRRAATSRNDRVQSKLRLQCRISSCMRTAKTINLLYVPRALPSTDAHATNCLRHNGVPDRECGRLASPHHHGLSSYIWILES